MDKADLHVELALRTRLLPGETSELMNEAAQAAAYAAAEVLAYGESFGRSASVKYRVEYNVRTVDQETPLARQSVEFVEVAEFVESVEVISVSDAPYVGEDYDSVPIETEPMETD